MYKVKYLDIKKFSVQVMVSESRFAVRNLCLISCTPAGWNEQFKYGGKKMAFVGIRLLESLTDCKFMFGVFGSEEAK